MGPDIQRLPGLFPELRRAAVVTAWFAATLFVWLVPSAVAAASAHSEEELWNALRSGGHIAIIRHALAPGTGDPDNFELRDCSTQRNLDDVGRDQARKIGNTFRAHGIKTARVFSSQWCRTLETARLLDLGEVEELPILNSFRKFPHMRDDYTILLKRWIDEQDFSTPVVLVSHQVNISAMTGIYPEPGEIIVAVPGARGRIEVLGTIRTY